MTQEQANTLVINADEIFCKAGWICSASGLITVTIPHDESWDRRLAETLSEQPGREMLPTQLVNVKAFKPASTNKSPCCCH